MASSQLNINGYDRFQIRFKSSGFLGKDWIYGAFLDSDSLFRTVAYRNGGTWRSLPFHCDNTSIAADIEMYADTLYIIGYFNNLFDENKGVWLPFTGVIKFHNDSLWIDDPVTLYTDAMSDMSTKGDSIVIEGTGYSNPPQVITRQFMSGNKGASWQYPYSIVHPTNTVPDFGPIFKVQILDNGDIMTLNNSSPPSTSYNGVIRWDGQWNSYGNGIKSLTQAGDFIFYKGELYMGGNFNTKFHPLDPGKLIARWDGVNWQDVGGGLEGIVGGGFFVYDSVLYCGAYDYDPSDVRFGDAAIPHLAGWDGHQWCGTPANYFTHAPSSFGIINDTLFAAFYKKAGILNGDSSVYIMYFDGDYIHGPNSICSTPGLGLEESEQKPTIQVYPNPAKDVLNVEFPKGNENYRYELYSMDGRLLQHGELNAENNRIKVTEGLSGLCVLKLIGEQEVLSLKVAVER